MRFLATTVLVAAIAAGLGLGSIWLALAHPPFSGEVRIGPWRGAASFAAADGDPYLRARLARSGRVPMSTAVGAAFVATVDDAGAGLDPSCHYRVAGQLADADLWTLAATGADGALVAEGLRASFSSRDTLRSADGFVITAGPTARPGNYLPTSGLSGLVLTLRLYDAGLAAAAAELRLPSITRLECP